MHLNVDLIKTKIIYIDSIAKMSLFSLLAHYGTGDNETEKFFLIPLAFLQHTAFITRSLDACNGLVLSGCRWLHGVRSASAPESISLWTKHQPLLHICLVVFGVFFCRGIAAKHFCPEVHLFIYFKYYSVELKTDRENGLPESSFFVI